MSLVWTNHGGFSQQRSDQLKTAFLVQLEAAQIRIVQGEAAPALRIAIELTPSQVVISASVPGEGATSVVMEEIARSLVKSDEQAGSDARLEKELLLQQEGKILSAAVTDSVPGSDQGILLLTADALELRVPGQGSWSMKYSKPLPAPRQAQRGSRGQLLLTEENPDRVVILLPGRRCEVSLRDEAPIACAPVNAEWPSGRLLAAAACGAQTWWLRSDSTDWTTEDRLLLRNSGAARDSAPGGEVSVPGPVQAISAGPNPSSATVVVRNLSTGNYEVYRVALSCGH